MHLLKVSFILWLKILGTSKEAGQKPEFFGRDEAYDHPNTLPILKSEEVKHIHLAAIDAPFLNSIQFYQSNLSSSGVVQEYS